MRALAARLLAAACLLLAVHGAAADLTISGPRCGVLACAAHEYCSSFETQCRPCAAICDRASHNFEEQLCVDACQGYLHDARYVRIGQTEAARDHGNSDNSAKDTARLYALVTSALVLVVLLTIAAIGYAAFGCYQWARRHDLQPKNILSYLKGENNNEDAEKGSPNGLSTTSTATATGMQKEAPLRLHLTGGGTLSGSEPPTTPATMMTTASSSRRPAEDSALDYAYDNHAMAGTPSPHAGQSPRESNF